MKHILFITTTFPSDQLPFHGTFNFKAVNELQKKIPVKVIHLRSNNFKRPFLKKRSFKGIDVIEISIFHYSSFTNRFTAFNIGIYKRLAYILIKNHINKNMIIHSVGLVLSGQVGAYISKKEKIKHIAQAIGSDINFILPELKNYWGVRSWEKNTDVITCNSKALEKEVKSHYKNQETKVIYRGVDLKQYPFTVIPKTKDIKYLFLGGISIIKSKVLFNRKHPIKAFNELGEDTKGGVLLLSAWKQWKQNTNNTNAILYYGGPNTSEDKLNRILDDNYKNYDIIHIGALKKNEVIQKMRESHVIVVPSYAEGLPNIAMEAFAIGRPVIATKVGGIPELINHKQTGYLFEKGNIKELIIALNYFLQNKNQIDLYSNSARKKVEIDYNSNKFAKTYYKFYNED
jgi:glycosyltransferase involved in cell wall biosynthesis